MIRAALLLAGAIAPATALAAPTLSAVWSDHVVVQRGQPIVVEGTTIRSLTPFPSARLAHCVFEHVYFSRPDSYVFGQSVNQVRTELGRRLARESAAPADVVVPVPDSGVCAAGNELYDVGRTVIGNPPLAQSRTADVPRDLENTE